MKIHAEQTFLNRERIKGELFRKDQKRIFEIQARVTDKNSKVITLPQPILNEKDARKIFYGRKFKEKSSIFISNILLTLVEESYGYYK